jgi:hypothetical protein
MISMVTSRPPLVRLRWILISALGVVPPLFFFAVWLRGFWAVEKDARSARMAIASGRHRQAREPLARWLRARPASAEAHAFMAQVALDEGDLAKVTDELNQARALGYPNSALERLHAVSLSRIGRYAEAEPILIRRFNSQSSPDPAVDEALARVYMMTHRPNLIGAWNPTTWNRSRDITAKRYSAIPISTRLD